MLTGHVAVLRPWQPDDLDALGAIRNDVALQRSLMARPRGATREATRAWLEQRNAGPLDLLLVIVPRGEPASVAGFVQLAQGDPTNRHAALGICVIPSRQGSGLAGDALELLAAHARAALGLRKIVLSVLSENARAVAFYRRHGFREVGVQRGHFLWDDVWLDVTLMERMLSA